VPFWAKDISIGSRLINARSETISEKPAFKRAFARRRCLLPADGYYEWQKPEAGEDAAEPGPGKSGGAGSGSAGSGSGSGSAGSGSGSAGSGQGKAPAKQPFYITRGDGGPLAFAGLYELWRDKAVPDDDPDAWLWTATVITTSAPDDLGRIHDRMPMVIEPRSWADWLDPANNNVDDLRALLAPAAAAVRGLISYPVSRAVGSVRNNGPELIEPVELTGPELDALGLGPAGRRPPGRGADRLF
jgi:putative SOS response-associated peptidase YedK